MDNNNISLGQSDGKNRVREFSTYETTEKKLNRKCHNSMGKKATNFGLQLFNGTPKFPYKFKEIISLRYSSVTTTTTTTTTKFTLNIFRMACKPFQAESFQTIRRFFACLKNSLHLLTLSQVHNGP